jgi:hypothetical protein
MMKKRLGFIFVSALLMQVLWIGVVSAQSSSYNDDNDITVDITVLEDDIQTSDSTGEFTFEAQEDAHQMFTESSGEEVQHSYIWIEVNGSKILAVDPPCAMYN